MAYKACTSCNGTGRVYFGEYSTCTSCMGTGTMYVADKTDNIYGNKKSFGNSGSSSGKTHSFEDYVTSLLTIVTFVYVSFVWLSFDNMEWYIVMGIGLFFSIIVYMLFSGPLRFLITWLGYLIGIGILILIIYGIIVAIKG